MTAKTLLISIAIILFLLALGALTTLIFVRSHSQLLGMLALYACVTAGTLSGIYFGTLMNRKD
jgi:hypothetical protein